MAQNYNEMKIEIKVDEATAAGKYSNYTNISSSPEEFVLDFLFVQPTPPPGFGKLMSRVILTPGHAKRLARILSDKVRDYESRFGEIVTSGSNTGRDNIQ